MRDFAALYQALDASTRTHAKVATLVDFFRRAEPRDAAWVVWFLIGNKPKQAVKSTHLRQWAAAEAGIADWLFAESYDAVGDLAETIALLLPAPVAASDSTSLAEWVETRIVPLRNLSEDEQREHVLTYWQQLTASERFVFNKLITGGFRVGASQGLVHRALATVADVAVATIAHRLMGDWKPTGQGYLELLSPESAVATLPGQPFPFMLANPHDALQVADHASVESVLAESFGAIDDWIFEWKWDGIRGQLIRRAGATYLWSRGDAEISTTFPELMAAAARLPDCVIDGEIVVLQDGKVAPFNVLQQRLNRKTVSRKMQDTLPVMMLVYDLLELAGEDYRGHPLAQRRSRLADVLYRIPWSTSEVMRFDVSSRIRAPSWGTLARAQGDARLQGAEGLMLKRAQSTYQAGRVRGDWWKWKTAPMTLDAVLIYAQRGHGKRASLYTDYTFGLWQESAGGRTLVPFAKAYSGLSDAEIREVDAFIRKNTLEQFGPVRTVRPALVFELAFEGIARSSRHKSGIAVRFPRMLRIRTDKKPEDADTVAGAVRLVQ
jgi:DNA ligase 1